MLQILRNPKFRFFLVIGAVPILLVAAAIGTFSLDLPFSTLGLLLVFYWAFALWFVLSASARNNVQLTAAELFMDGFWISVALFLTVAISTLTIPSMLFIGV